MSALDIRFHRGGIHLPKLSLWLDPHEAQSGPDRVFVSHAHSDHIGAHREVILSAPTAKLMQARLAGERIEHVLPFGEKRSFESNAGHCPYQLTLLPAGHIFGSAMGLVEAEGASLLYTGDFKLRPGLSAEPCEPRPADILIMETTYGRREYRFPAAADVLQGIIRFCREALDNDETPVLLGYSMGKSQELLCGLGDAELPIMLHGQVFKLTEIYKQFGQCFPNYEKYDLGSARGKVLLCPPSVANSAMLRNIGRTRTAILTGWAVDPSCRFRYRTDAAFALSDHADFPDLIEFVKRVNPKKVYTLHGFAADFAVTLRELGYNAEALSEEEQLALPLAHEPVRRVRRLPYQQPPPRADARGIPQPGNGSHAPASPADAFRAFAEICLQIGATSKKLEKVGCLADYLRTLDPEALDCVNVWFTGNPFAPTDNKVLQLGWAVIRDALCAVGEIDHAEFGQIYLKHSDLGETAFEILLKRAASEATLSIRSVQALFEQLHSARGPLSKLPWLIRLLQQCTALEGKYLTKILTGDLRIGLKEGLVEEAIARAFGVSLDEVKRANLLVGNIGQTARLAQRGALNSATLIPFRPLKYMLASPEETSGDIWARVSEWRQTSERAAIQNVTGPEAIDAPRSDFSDAAEGSGLTVWLEDKYDGIRCQLHKVGSRAALYSRDLKEITGAFLELADLARSVPMDFVLDGEIVAMRGPEVLPFSELQRRLGRREEDLFLREEIPVQFIAFDLLWFNGESYLDQPLRTRRGLLETLAAFRRSHITQAESAEEIERAFLAARERGNEGLMIKDPLSIYTPGRRGLAWLKLKKAFGTLDCVVIGAEYGHGKRKDVLSDYTFAVRDEATGELKAIGKAYTGLTDAEIAALTRHFLAKARRQHGRYFEVPPDTVLEIAFDAVQESNRHASGLALRFPRIQRIRSDKAPEQINTVADARKLLKSKS